MHFDTLIFVFYHDTLLNRVKMTITRLPHQFGLLPLGPNNSGATRHFFSRTLGPASATGHGERLTVWWEN